MRELLIRTGEALYGPRFQSDLARALSVNDRTMRRWIVGEFEPPAGIKAELAALVAARKDELAALMNELNQA